MNSLNRAMPSALIFALASVVQDVDNPFPNKPLKYEDYDIINMRRFQDGSRFIRTVLRSGPGNASMPPNVRFCYGFRAEAFDAEGNRYADLTYILEENGWVLTNLFVVYPQCVKPTAAAAPQPTGLASDETREQGGAVNETTSYFRSSFSPSTFWRIRSGHGAECSLDGRPWRPSALARERIETGRDVLRIPAAQVPAALRDAT